MSDFFDDIPVAPTPPKAADPSVLGDYYARKHGVDPALVQRVLRQESRGKQFAKSPVGASGYMQLMPDTARSLGVKDIYDPHQNIDAGVRYLKKQLDDFGDVNLALAAYNAGPGAVKKYGNRVPPYRETQNYVKTIGGGYTGNGLTQSQSAPGFFSDVPAAPQKADSFFDDIPSSPATTPSQTTPSPEAGTATPTISQAQPASAGVPPPSPLGYLDETQERPEDFPSLQPPQKRPDIYTTAGREQRDVRQQAETQGGALYRVPVGSGATPDAVKQAVGTIAKETDIPEQFVETWLKGKGLGLYEQGTQKPLESSPTGYADLPTEMIGQMKRDYSASLSLPSRAVRNVSEVLSTQTPGEMLLGTARELKKPITADPVTLTEADRAELAQSKQLTNEGQMGGEYERALVQPFEAFSAGLGTTAGNLVNVLGRNLGINAVRDIGAYLQRRGEITQRKSQLRPEGEVPSLGPEIARYATGAGLSIAELVLLKRASGLPLPIIMAGESIARDMDKPAEVRAQNAVTAFGSGLLLDKTGALGRLPAAIAQTGLDVGQGVLAGDSAATIAAKGVGGAILGAGMGGGEGEHTPGLRESIVRQKIADTQAELRALSPRAEISTPEAVPTPERAAVGQEAQAAPVTETIIKHSDPRIDGGRVIGQTSDGRLKVENNEGGVSIVQHPRKGGNREAALVRREVVNEVSGIEDNRSGDEEVAGTEGSRDRSGGAIAANSGDVGRDAALAGGGRDRIQPGVPESGLPVLSVAGLNAAEAVPQAEATNAAPDRLNAPTAPRSFPQSAEAAGLSKGTNLTYEVQADAPAVERASARIDAQGADKVAADIARNREPSKDDVVAAQLLAKRYSEAGDHEREVAVINDLAEKLTKAGQSVQAASLISRLSPEGVLIQGQRLLNKRGANRTLTVEEATSLKETATRVREAEAKVSDLQRQIEEMKLRPQSGQRPARSRLETFEQRLGRLEAEARARLAARKAAGSQKGAVMLRQGKVRPTDTPEFRRFFEGSKVVDEKGEPRIVYHGTGRDFTEFSQHDKRASNTEPGFFFAPDPEIASRYAGWDENFPADKIGHVMPVYLDIKNPLTVDFKGGKFGRREAIERARAEGYDGVRFLNHYDAGGVQEQWVAFKPEQIKSATGNSGAFDPKNKNILGASAIPLELADYAIIGAVKLAKKGVTVARWTDEMVSEFGEEIKPHLRAIYRQSYAQLKTEREAARREARERAVQRDVPGPMRPEDVRRLVAERTQAQKDAQRARGDLERTFRNLSRTKAEKVAEAGTSFRRANLLTAAKTHLRNITSNTGFQGTEEASRPLAAVGDMIAKRKTGMRTTYGLNIPAVVKATIAAGLTEGPARARDIMLGREVLPLEGYRPGAESMGSKMQLHESETGSKILDAYVNTVYRSLEAEDAVFKVYAFRRELADIARSQAESEKAKDSSVNVPVRARELQQNPTDAMLTEASAYADYATFQNKNVVSDAIAGAKRTLTEKAGPLPKFAIESIAPFDRTPTNIIARTIENSPAGFISAAMKYRRIGKRAAAEQLAGRVADEAFTRQEQKDFARTFGRASTGTILSVLWMALAHKGLLSGASDYDTDKKDYMEKRRKFGGGGMLKIPGTNQYVSIADTPVGKAMATAAAIYEQMTKHTDREKGDYTFDERLTGAGKAALNVLTDQPLIRGLRDMAGSASVGEGLGNYGASYVPGEAALKAGADVADPQARIYRGQGIASPFRMLLPPQIPGGRGGLPVDTGIDTGERGGVGRRVLRGLDPFNTTTEGRGPQKREKSGRGSSRPSRPARASR